ncbi:sensor histidine kinase [Cryobacterium sp. SO1]|uniref:sensor histidine kinase n=1 Tax=Cryobacterium sp. SO1 TaxID=1897061 RepID=UPI0010CFA73F|nr:sensor histidine kinase [Cryobacterium sp. SO1]RZI36544.1 Sensor histidine kinase DesK [Cryobacterium sp. SO1]
MPVPGFFTRTAPLRWALEPALGVIFALAWGTPALWMGQTAVLLTVWMFAIAVGLSRFAPLLGLAIGAVATTAVVTAGTGYVSWPGAVPLLLTSGCLAVWGAGLYGRRGVRFVGLSAALLLGMLVTVFQLLPLTMPNPQDLPTTLRFLGDLGFGLAGGFLAALALVGGWALALVVRGRADRRMTAGPVDPDALTLETWLMLPQGAPTSTVSFGIPFRGPLVALVGDLFGGRTGGRFVLRAVSRRTLAVDVGISVAFFLFCLILDAGTGVMSFLVLVGFTTALAVRRLSPGLALTLAWVSALAQMLAGLPVLMGNFAVLAVLYATTAYGGKVLRWAGLVCVGVGAILAAAYIAVGQRGVLSVGDALAQGNAADLVWSFVVTLIASVAVLGLSWTLGLLMRTWQTAREGRLSQHRAVEEQRVAQRSVVVEQERNRIARDMHDVVAHSLAVVIAQADGARYARAANPEAVDEALTTISSTAREALGDVRILLTRLRQDDAAGPQPVLADLDRLVTQMQSTGLDIEWTTTGTPTTLGSGAQLAVYRIVQEALTNALRHGDADRSVYLTLAWTEGWVAVTIDNAVGVDSSTDHSGEIGHGLPGMRERALLAGGSLAAESIGDRFIVAARLPAITTNALAQPAATLPADQAAALAAPGAVQ